MDFLSETRRFCPELAEEIHQIAEKVFVFAGERPTDYSQTNREYLWLAEHRADRFKRIDLQFRVEMVEYIIGRWKQNLKGYSPYQNTGYRIFMWRTLGPKISVLPYVEDPPGDNDMRVMDSLEEFLRPLARRSWQSHFSGGPIDISKILRVIEAMGGSIGRPSADRLGVTRAELRKLIEDIDLVDEVNRIRKRFKRRPAALTHFPIPRDAPAYEIVLPPRY